MAWEAWLTLGVVVALLVILIRELVAPALGVMGAVIFLLVAGVVTPAQAFAGFSNAAPITVAALYVVARAVEKTGALERLTARILGTGADGGMSDRRVLARLLVPVAGASAFLNNTPIVAMLLPQVRDWAERNGTSPSIYLMPLSFAVILGGVVTAIGTSTNLVISGLLEANGFAPMGLFEISRLGLPVAAVGIAMIVWLAPSVLPARRGARREFTEDLREFAVSMLVVPQGPLDGKPVEAGGLRHLTGVFLVAIEREGERIAPVAPTSTLHGGDRLTFVGRADLVVDLQKTRGLASAEHQHLAGLDSAEHTFFEAVVGQNSPLVGDTLKNARFRARYQAAVVAIHRAGERVQAKLGEVELHFGDTLLLLADPQFADRWRDRRDFLLISRLGGSPPTTTRQAAIVGALLLGIVVVAGSGLLPILHASLLAAIALVLLGVLSPGEARDAVDLDVVVVLAGSLGVGLALEHSGLADAIGSGLVELVGGSSRTAVLLGLVVATVALTEMITNNAAAALMFPIALAAAGDLGVDARPFAIAIAVAASASFLTPIGYQTNTMVYGPGGYRFGDYSRLGAPLTLLVIATIVALG
ncbi:MAG TPA: SLC13 family permease [Myxococcota bacterium]|nr:SLC13 family permease [Myxococcota bacterium]